MSFGQRLKSVVESLHLTQEEFADKIGVSRSILAKYFSDKSKPSVEIVSRLVSHYANISSRWLLTGEGKMLRCISNNENKKYEPNISSKEDVNETRIEYYNILKSKDAEIESLKNTVIDLQSQIIKQLKK